MRRLPLFGVILGLTAALGAATAFALAPASDAPSGEVWARANENLARANINASSIEDCRRWSYLADRMGETFAGHRLRTVLLARNCAFSQDAAPAADAVWGWPWRQGALSSARLPPIVHGRYAGWIIRCGHAGQRRRCALIGSVPLEPRGAVTATTHFVIDTIDGRESMIWRVMVRRGSALIPPAREIELGLDEDHHTIPFAVCGFAGCLGEADPKLSADVATWLWDGKSAEIALPAFGADGPNSQSGTISARGFRQAFTELVRLRRAEGPAYVSR